MASSERGDYTIFQAVVEIVLLFVGFFASIVSLTLTHINKTDLEQYKRKMDEKQRRQEKDESIEELMKQYKKPLIQSAFELQSRLKEQISRNLLHVFNRQGEERRTYVFLSTMYLFCEFLGWLEIVRREVVFITGPKAEMLNQVIDDIKFQFTGETVIQGVEDSSETSVQFDGDTGVERKWSVLQILNVQLRAIGEAMITHRTYDDQCPNQLNTGLEVIGFIEFVERHNGNLLTNNKPADGAAAGMTDHELEKTKKTFKYQWQVAFKPLATSIARLMELKGDAPKERITMLQVLLCKLIDILDDGGQNCDDMHGGQFLSRNNRITPMVAKLSAPALKWLAGRPYMGKDPLKKAVGNDVYEEWCKLTSRDDPLARSWWEKHNKDLEKYVGLKSKLSAFDNKYCTRLEPEDLAKLAFPGFRADIAD